ncbi:MAG TPA: alpha-isopropylmalate synthase regulatory domain-containing protein, partial [Pseudomonadales bacterium]|nr:alpha-isopropylmalate synthase regulatory domain-containing protein [Pseudomonadales bacterium]
KGGIAYLLENGYGLVMPRRMQIEFSNVVQKHTDEHGGEVNASQIWELFQQEYAKTQAPIHYVEHHLFEQGSEQGIRITLEINGDRQTLAGAGNGPIDAVINALKMPIKVVSFEERSLGQGADAKAAAIIEIAVESHAEQIKKEFFGVGINPNIVTASIHAILAAVNRSAGITQLGSKAITQVA